MSGQNGRILILADENAIDFYPLGARSAPSQRSVIIFRRLANQLKPESLSLWIMSLFFGKSGGIAKLPGQKPSSQDWHV
jgi:hypothetical protein